ncbi:MAG: biopolymer transporter ExbD [Krumholzibacteria bacterium]|nr:biopolymer transporter ExbD [Candidatus Krumholzibacteria bacterium]
MKTKKRRGGLQGLNDANITPLADVTTTLIVVFLITMPALMWNGIQVNSAEAGNEKAVIKPTEAADDGLLTVAVTAAGIALNGVAMDARQLESELTAQLAAREDKTVVIVPDDDVILGAVVEVLDIAKASGAVSLAMLNEIGR